MLLEASEKVMYQKMDRREKSRMMFYGSMAALFLSLLLWGFAVLDAEGIYYAVLSAVSAAAGFREWRRMKRGIMPLTGCFIRLEEGRILVRQAKGGGKYEACTAYCSEVEKVVPVRQCGVPAFFIVLKRDTIHSSIQDEDSPGRTVFCVKGEGYGRYAFAQLYSALCRKLPAGAVPAGGGEYTKWKRRWIEPYDIFLWILSTLYLLPVFMKLL